MADTKLTANEQQLERALTTAFHKDGIIPKLDGGSGGGGYFELELKPEMIATVSKKYSARNLEELASALGMKPDQFHVSLRNGEIVSLLIKKDVDASVVGKLHEQFVQITDGTEVKTLHQQRPAMDIRYSANQLRAANHALIDARDSAAYRGEENVPLGNERTADIAHVQNEVFKNRVINEFKSTYAYNLKTHSIEQVLGAVEEVYNTQEKKRDTTMSPEEFRTALTKKLAEQDHALENSGNTYAQLQQKLAQQAVDVGTHGDGPKEQQFRKAIAKAMPVLAGGHKGQQLILADEKDTFALSNATLKILSEKTMKTGDEHLGLFHTNGAEKIRVLTLEFEQSYNKNFAHQPGFHKLPEDGLIESAKAAMESTYAYNHDRAHGVANPRSPIPDGLSPTTQPAAVGAAETTHEKRAGKTIADGAAKDGAAKEHPIPATHKEPAPHYVRYGADGELYDAQGKIDMLQNGDVGSGRQVAGGTTFSPVRDFETMIKHLDKSIDLGASGYNTKNGIDNSYGDHVEAAVRKFQEAHHDADKGGLEVTGKLDKRTRDQLTAEFQSQWHKDHPEQLTTANLKITDDALQDALHAARVELSDTSKGGTSHPGLIAGDGQGNAPAHFGTLEGVDGLALVRAGVTQDAGGEYNPGHLRHITATLNGAGVSAPTDVQTNGRASDATAPIELGKRGIGV